MEKLEQFKSNSNINPALIDAVINQLGGDEEYTYQQLEDIANHGINGGFSGFIYYTDTVAFFEANSGLILELLHNESEELGFESNITMVKGFRCAADFTEDEIGQTIYGGESDQYVANCLAWYAGESVAYAYQTILEDES